MNWERFLAMELYVQVLLAALAVLLIVFLGMILRQLVGYSLAVLVSNQDTPRAKGWVMAGAGVGMLAFAVGAVVLQEYLHSILGTASVVVSMGLLAAGLYALADGIGVLLWRRERGGVVMLLWGIIGGVAWLLAR